MRIRKLRFKNLNSLRGEFAIDFSAPPLVDAGLFAVTGSTGAGKSTIFDALCLGLYGQTPRLQKRKAGGEGIFEIVSRHTAEASAEVEFELGRERYRSAWECHRARGSVEGQFQAPKMYLLDLNTETLLEEKLSEVPVRVAELSGLDFERFTRSVLLAQGAFAAFLHAEPAERADLLEKMTGSAIYSEVSRLSFERAKEEQRRYDELQSRVAELQLMDEEELAVLERDRLEAETRSAELQTKRDQLIVSREKALRIASLRTSVEEKRKEFATLEEERPRIREARKSLEAHARALTVKPLLTGRDERAAELQAIEEALRERTEALALLEEREKGAQRGEREAGEARSAAERELHQAGEIRSEAERLGYQLAEKQNRIEVLHRDSLQAEESLTALDTAARSAAEARKKLEEEGRLNRELINSQPLVRLNEKFELVKHLFALYTRNREATASLVGRKEELARTLAEHPEGEAIDLGAIRELEKQYHTWEALAAKASRAEELQRSLEESRNSVETLVGSIEAEEHSLKVEAEKLTRVEAAEREDLARSLRGKLKRGSPCPVCGATEHPFRGEQELFPQGLPEISSLEELRARVGEGEVRLAGLRERLHGLKERIVSQEEELEPLQVLLAESSYSRLEFERLRTRFSEAQSAWEAREKRKPLEDELQSLEKEAGLRRAELEEARASLEEILDETGIPLEADDPLRAVEERVLRFRRTEEEERERIETLQVLDRDAKERSAKRHELDQILKAKQEEATLLKEESEANTRALEALTGGIPFEEFHAARQAAAAEAARRHDESQKVLSSLREELAGVKSAIETRRAQADESRRRLEELTEELLVATAEAGFSDLELLREALLEEAEELGRSVREFDERELSLSRKIEELEGELNQAPEELQDLEGIENRLQALIREHDTALARRQELSTQLRQEQGRRLEAGNLQLKINDQRKELDIWLRLKELIGSAKGDSFRRFAQGLTLEYLIRLANHHLIRFSGRYRLRREEGSELRMEIVDTWQADAVRPVGTLSGGETFLASLALALGLSELAGRKTRIDSLFLDEGFGSLDGETLETVIAALESLQSGGKLIGIISHVEALKERLPVQIRVQRRGTGYSKLELVPAI